MKKIYLLSNQFDYTKMICADAGPQYAANMSWEYDYLNNISKYQDYINIIDTRLIHREYIKLYEYINNHKDIIFLFTIIDPYQEYCQDDWFYKLLVEARNFDNVFYLSKYIPSESVQELDVLTNYKKIIFIPYPFVDKYKIKNNLLDREKKIIITGATDPKIYPDRAKFKKVALSKNPINLMIHPLNAVVRKNVHFLKHPDYPDLVAKLRHDIIGDKYIDYLSKFVFMLLTSSRCNLEFLKYSECAYAKCIPVGNIPDSFSDKMREPFLEIDFNAIGKSVQQILEISDSELLDRSQKYYEAFKLERNPEVLNLKLNSFLDSLIKN